MTKGRMSKNALVIFAKYPQAGKVKTRLASAIGPRKAARLYAAFLKNLWAAHGHQPYHLMVAFTPAHKKKQMKRLLGKQEGLYLQRGADLGERISFCFRELLQKYNKISIIGADLPHLKADAIENAFRKLDDVDVVLGPSEDGGYYLIALKQWHEIFDNIAWGSSTVLKQQIRNIQQQGLKAAFLEKRYDIDTYEDLCRLKNETKRGMRNYL